VPTLAEIKSTVKKSDIGFIGDLEGLGFVVGPAGFWFYREREELIDVIDVWRKSSGKWIGKWIEVPVITYHRKIVEKKKGYDFSNFPKKFHNLGKPADYCIAKDGINYPCSWRVGDNAEIENSFKQIAAVIKEHGDAWKRFR